MILSYPDAHLICINDLSSLTVCLNLSICQHAFTHVCIATCNLSAYTFVMCKIKATYLLYFTYLVSSQLGHYAGGCANCGYFDAELRFFPDGGQNCR